MEGKDEGREGNKRKMGKKTRRKKEKKKIEGKNRLEENPKVKKN